MSVLFARLLRERMKCRITAARAPPPQLMKRYLPFLIIALVAVLTIGVSAMFLRAQRRAIANQPINPPPPGAGQLEPTHTLGPATAPVTLEEYGDFQCPSCAATSQIIHALGKEYGDRLRVIFWQFPLAMHPHAREAALAAEAASRQGRFWEMHDLLYRNQSSWKDSADVGSDYETFAQEIGLNTELFRHDLANAGVAARVDAEHAEGEARGVKGTPTLFINGQEFPPPFAPVRLRERIDSALGKPKSP